MVETRTLSRFIRHRILGFQAENSLLPIVASKPFIL